MAFEIVGWDWGYSLSLSSSTGKYRDDDPYLEFRHLLITGKLLRPARLKTGAVEVSLLPSNVLLRGSKFRYRSARLTGVRLEMKLDENDEPAEDASG